MKKLPSWLTYAAKIKSQISRLPEGEALIAMRARVILDSHLIAKTKHQYPGTLADWDYIVAHSKNARCRPQRAPVLAED